MVLFSGYSLGLGVPFLLIGLGMESVSQLLRRFQSSMRWVQLASGLFLILIGLLLVTNQMFQIAIWAHRNGFFLNPSFGAAAVPTYLIAVMAGLLSFFSPCVLPLVPAYMGYLKKVRWLLLLTPQRIPLASPDRFSLSVVLQPSLCTT